MNVEFYGNPDNLEFPVDHLMARMNYSNLSKVVKPQERSVEDGVRQVTYAVETFSNRPIGEIKTEHDHDSYRISLSADVSKLSGLIKMVRKTFCSDPDLTMRLECEGEIVEIN